MNKKSIYLIPLSSFLILIYGILFYLIIFNRRFIDFTPFYFSAKALINGINPYPISPKIPVNLNPPFFLYVTLPLGFLSYYSATLLWAFVSFFMGLAGIRLVFFYSFTEEFIKKYHYILYLLYFSFFPILIDRSVVQVGAFLLFFIMYGYHYYLQGKDSYASLLWGFIIALKLFPALLFFFVLKQRRYRVFCTMLVIVLLSSLLPLLLSGTKIYAQYFSMMSVIYWYGDNWNGSLYGYLFRVILDLSHPIKNVLSLLGPYLLLFLIFLLTYLKAMGPKYLLRDETKINHQPFCLTLAMMLFLSPFGWLYYFSLLIFPLLLTGFVLFTKPIPLALRRRRFFSLDEKTKAFIPLVLWVSSFVLINFPEPYIRGMQMQTYVEMLSFYSFYFYGLSLLVILLLSYQKLPGNQDLNFQELRLDNRKKKLLIALLISLLYGIAVPMNGFLLRLDSDNTSAYDIEELEKLIK